MAPELIKIQLMSDLHLETPKSRPTYNEFEIQPQCRYLALLGDIGNVTDEALFQFLKRQLKQFEITFFVLGNHEPYHSTYPQAVSRLRQFETDSKAQQQSKTGEFVFLDRRRHDLSDTISALGCTLYSHVLQHQMRTVSMFCSDFQDVDNWTVEMHNEAHEENLAWLNEQVRAIQHAEPHRKIIIMSHHCPTMAKETASASRLEDANGVRSVFSTDLSLEPCWICPQVAVWAFEHTHFNCDYLDQATGKRMIANQKGYRRSENVDFNANKVVAIEENLPVQ